MTDIIRAKLLTKTASEAQSPQRLFCWHIIQGAGGCFSVMQKITVNIAEMTHYSFRRSIFIPPFNILGRFDNKKSAIACAFSAECAALKDGWEVKHGHMAFAEDGLVTVAAQNGIVLGRFDAVRKSASDQVAETPLYPGRLRDGARRGLRLVPGGE